MPTTSQRLGAYARLLGIVSDADSRLRRNQLAATAKIDGPANELLRKVRFEIGALSKSMPEQLVVAVAGFAPVTLERAALADNPSALDAALSANVGLPMTAFCGWGPFVDRSLAGPERLPNTD